MSETAIYYDQEDVTPGSEEEDIWEEIINLIAEIIASLVPPPTETLDIIYVSEGESLTVLVDRNPSIIGPNQKTFIISKCSSILELCGCDADPLLDFEVSHAV